MVNQRPRGILTHSDRELLRMDGDQRLDEYSRPNLSQRWGKIEERCRNGVHDLGFLYQNLPPSQRQDVFAPLVEVMFPWSPIILLEDAFGWLLLGVLDPTNRELDDEEFYETVFSRSIERVLRGVSVSAGTIDVSVTIDGWAPYDELHEHEELSELQQEHLRSLLNAGEISDQEFAEAILAQSDSE